MTIKFRIFLGILLLFCTIGTYQYSKLDTSLGDPFHYKTGVRCGKVIDNFTELHNVKHGTRTDYFLKVQYDNCIKVEEVDAKTFYDWYKIGTTVCFTNSEVVSVYMFAVLILDYFIVGVGGFILIIMFLHWLFDAKW